MSNRALVLFGALATVVALVVGWWLWRTPDEPTSPDADAPGRPLSRTDDPDAGSVAEPQHASIAGAVLRRDDFGKAIAGARVCAWPVDARQDRSLEPIRARCATTGADGRYRIAELEPGRVRVTAGAPGQLPAVWLDPAHEERPWLALARGEARTGIDLALADGGLALAGTVVDVSGGPIEGALVVASGPGMFEREPVAADISDAQGRFSMFVRQGEYRLRAEGSGYAPTLTIAQAPNQAIELRLTPESVLIGRVVDESGEPVAGVSVTAEPGRAHPVSVSDEQGRFRLGGLLPGIYQPEAIGPGVYGQAALPVHVGLGQTSEPIELRVHAAVGVRGQIVAHDLRGDVERGCAGGHVLLRGGGFSRSAVADDEGWVELDGVPPGRHELDVHCPEQIEPLTRTLELAGDLDDQRWVIDVGGWRILGRAVDASGRGVEGVYVDSTGPGGASHNRSEADGDFYLLVHERGTHSVTANLRGRKDKLGPFEVEVADADVEGLEIVVGEIASVRGRVVDPSLGHPGRRLPPTSGLTASGMPSGAAVPGVRTAVCDARGRPLHYAVSDGEGNFAFDALPPGRYYVALGEDVRVDNEEPGEVVELVAGRVAEVTLVTEREVGSIRGTVTAEGGPVPDAWIVASRGSVESLVSDWEIGPVLAEVDGSFTLDGLGEGSWAVRAFRREGGEASVAGIALGSSVELELAASASVAGRVRLPDRSAPGHFEIEARSGEHRRRASFYRSEGAFELAELPAGTWTLEVRALTGSAKLEIELDPGETIVDLEIELEPRVTITGRAVDSRSGEPVVSVDIGLQQGGFGRKVQPGADGRFELTGVPIGRVQLLITPRDWRAVSHRMQIWVIDVDPAPAIQDIGELPLAGGSLGPDETPGTLGLELEIAGFSEDGSTIDEQAVKVRALAPGGPAASAGLRVGDVITSFDGVSVEGRRAAHAFAYLKVAAGDAVTLERRDGTSVSLVAAPLAE